MTKRIVFVGQEQPLWEEFRACCASAESGWRPEFTASGQAALEVAGEPGLAAVVADVQLPDMSGVELLDAIIERQPKAFRVVLSDLGDTESTLECVGRGHHHLLKPCDAGTLITALEQAATMETWLPSETVQGLIAQMRRVPSPPNIYFQIASETRSENASVERIGELIAQDPALTAKVLQLANSAVFGLQLQVIHPVEAVAYLGLETTQALVLVAHSCSWVEKTAPKGFSVETLWRHSVLTARFARRIVQYEEGGPEAAEQASAAGLLHDIGKLLFAANLPRQFSAAMALAREQRVGLWEAESQVLGASHAELGGCLLAIWGLPAPMVAAVALHHHPLACAVQGFGPIAAVHVANVLAHEACPVNSGFGPSQMDMNYLAALGMEERLEAWRSQCPLPETELMAGEAQGRG